MFRLTNKTMTPAPEGDRCCPCRTESLVRTT